MVIHDRVRQHQEKLFSKLERSSLRTVSIYSVCESCYGYFEVYNSEQQQQRRYENCYHLYSTVKRQRFFCACLFEKVSQTTFVDWTNESVSFRARNYQSALFGRKEKGLINNRTGREERGLITN